MTSETRRLTDQDVKNRVLQHWNQRASAYDDRANHAIHSDAQHRAWHRLLGRLAGLTPKRVLDVGCGTGFLALLLAELGHRVTGLDLSPEMLDRAREKAQRASHQVTFDIGDAEQPEVPDQAFDVVVARHLIWTLPHPDRAVAAWQRALVPGGRLLLFEGAWRGQDQPMPADYEPLQGCLPFYGGADAERLAAFLSGQAFVDVTIEPLRDAVYWGSSPDRDRYVVSAHRPAMS